MNSTANDIRRLVEAGRTADAEELLRRKLAEVPTNAEWRTLLARVLAGAGRKPEAVQELGIAVDHAPGGREARLTLARLANELGQPELAARHARVLTERDARDSEAWSALGMAAFGLRNKREATLALRRAVAIAPTYAAARYNLASVLADQERSEEALDEAAVALRLGAKPRSVSLVQARAQIQLDRFEDAERELLTLLRADANDVDAHGMLHQLRQLRGDEEPLATLRAAAQLPAAPPRLRLAFANAARRSGATAEAEASLRDLMKSGRTTEAWDAARASIARLPDDAVVAENFVVAALCAGATADALPIVEKFRLLKPRDQRWITYRLDIARLRDEQEFASWFDPVDRGSAATRGLHLDPRLSRRPHSGTPGKAPATESSARSESAPRHPDFSQSTRQTGGGNLGPAPIVPRGSRGHAGAFRPRCGPSLRGSKFITRRNHRLLVGAAAPGRIPCEPHPSRGLGEFGVLRQRA